MTVAWIGEQDLQFVDFFKKQAELQADFVKMRKCIFMNSVV